MDRELALFDLDGCLVDSTEAITGAIADTFARLELPRPEPTDLTWCVGPPLRDSLEQLLDEAGADPALVAGCLDAYREVYARTWRERTRVIRGIPEALAAIGSSGLRLAVVTSKPLPIATRILEETGLRGYFSAVFGPAADHGAEVKASTLARALSVCAAGRAPRTAAMVGDREHDVLAGRSCGTGTIGVTWGAGDRVELERAGAAAIAERPDELVMLLSSRADRVRSPRMLRSRPSPRAGR